SLPRRPAWHPDAPTPVMSEARREEDSQRGAQTRAVRGGASIRRVQLCNQPSSAVARGKPIVLVEVDDRTPWSGTYCPLRSRVGQGRTTASRRLTLRWMLQSFESSRPVRVSALSP